MLVEALNEHVSIREAAALAGKSAEALKPCMQGCACMQSCRKHILQAVAQPQLGF
jgi:hypothetical protein